MLSLYFDTDMDVTPEIAQMYGAKLIPMPYVMDGKEIKPYVDFETFDAHTFYDKLRKGNMPTTNALNPEDYKELFVPEFEAGNDILYVHFSETMSCTFNNMNLALNELKKKYPGRKVYSVDTKGIVVCAYYLARMAGEMYKAGKSAEEIVAAIEYERDHVATYFYSDNLTFFRRSGRVGNLAAFMGNILGIHPILTMNDEGKMVGVAKVRGANQALRSLIDYVDKLGDNVKDHPIIIAHSDCMHLAEKLTGMLVERYGEGLDITYSPINPTAGAHCGPDTVGLSFYAKRR